MREWLASQGWNDVFLDIDPERGLVAADRWQKALNAAIGRHAYPLVSGGRPNCSTESTVCR